MKFDKKNLLLYAITDRAWLQNRTLKEDVEKTILGGATLIQLREKDLDKQSFIQEAKEIKEVCNKYNIPFIINDDIEVMLEVDADGIHIGQDDLNAREVRKMIGPDKILGVSCQTPRMAIEAQNNGADYLGVGAVFSTSTKLDALHVSKDTLRDICRSVDIGVIAIGGITLSNMKELKNTMIDGVSLVSAIFASNDIISSTKELKNEIKKIVFDSTKYKLGIFDYDGTILDSMTMWKRQASSFVKSIGYEADESFDELVKVNTTRETAQIIKDTYKVDLSAETLEEMINEYAYNIYTSLDVLPGAINLLEEFKKNNIKMVLLSATSKKLLKASLSQLGIAHYFSEIYSNSDLGLSKVDGKPYLYVSNDQGFSISDSLVVEDAPHAIKGAYLVNMDVLAVDEIHSKDNEDVLKYSNYYINLRKV